MIFRKLLSASLRIARIASRQCSSVKEYKVPPTGDINIITSHKTIIKPLDVVQHPDMDKVIISCNNLIDCNQILESTNIFCTDTSESEGQETLCEIFAPIKSNINVNSKNDIYIEKFLSENIRLYSKSGNIIIGESQNEYITAATGEGNIKTDGSITASKVEFKTQNAGNITALNKIKCLGLHCETVNGDISTQATFCNQSYFVTKNGFLNLKNVHKHSRIVINKEGTLNLMGFDGILEIMMTKGVAEVQISALRGRSSILIRENAKLTLRMSETALEETEISVNGKTCSVEDNIPYEENEDDDSVIIRPKASNKVLQVLKVECPNSSVTLNSSSWIDMVQNEINAKV